MGSITSLATCNYKRTCAEMSYFIERIAATNYIHDYRITATWYNMLITEKKEKRGIEQIDKLFVILYNFTETASVLI